jgi:hypothetical protein
VSNEVWAVGSNRAKKIPHERSARVCNDHSGPSGDGEHQSDCGSILMMNATLPPTRRRYVLLSAAVVVAILADRAYGTAAAQDVSLSVNDVVGCYELRSIDWTPALLTLPEAQWRLYTPPRFFTLTATPMPNSKYRRILSRHPEDRRRLANGAWMLTNDDELTAMFPRSGFEWLFLVVSHRSSDGHFSGRAVALTDTGPLEPKGGVVFGRVACWDN